VKWLKTRRSYISENGVLELSDESNYAWIILPDGSDLRVDYNKSGLTGSEMRKDLEKIFEEIYVV
jgi:hypothetical protein